MRLLNAKTFKLEEYIGEEIPEYTILSHTWGKEEVLYADILNSLRKARKKRGFKKIEYCAKQTLKDDLAYCWIDTCCIDKSSSSELSEAINSMFTWYARANSCYAYLEDVSSHSISGYDGPIPSYSQWENLLKGSRWFTRGWTLQELVAPEDLIFFSHEWSCLGTKQAYSRALTRMTGIDINTLRTGDFRQASVAQRMSWASRRTTTRKEDEAYCLMGIFDVNMPLLYGEGAKAFQRLQEEIIKSSDDQTIFLWEADNKSPACFRGLLARSPKEFQKSGDFVSWRSPRGEPFSMTNRGLRLHLFVPPRHDDSDTYEFYAHLNCTTSDSKNVSIRITRLDSIDSIDQLALPDAMGLTDQFVRVEPAHVIVGTHNIWQNNLTFEDWQQLYFRNTVILPQTYRTNRIAGFLLPAFQLKARISFTISVWPESNWSLDETFYRFPRASPGSVIFKSSGIITARIMWRAKATCKEVFISVMLPSYLFEFQFVPVEAEVRPTGLAHLLRSRHSKTNLGYFWGTFCHMKPSYDIGDDPTLDDMFLRFGDEDVFDGEPPGEALDLKLEVIDDEAVIVGSQNLKKLVEDLELDGVDIHGYA